MTLRQHTVPADARGVRLDAYLARLEPELSRSRLKALIESGEVTLDGTVCKPARLLRGGETITVAVEPPVSISLEPEQIALSVLYEDLDLIAVDKPAGMVVHPGAGNPSGTLVNALLGHCADLAGIGGELRPGIVHRLDKQTSGCIVIAKNEFTLGALQAQFKGRSVTKRYLAVVHGVPAACGRFETLHGRHPTDRLRFTGRVKEGRTAITEWSLQERFAGAALVSVTLFTGRTHQIRVHFSEAGHPLIGDELYGGVKREHKLAPLSAVRLAAERIGRQALHAHQLAFDHPRTGRRIELEAPLPADLRGALEVLRAAGVG